jgi:hypothetical protein
MSMHQKTAKVLIFICLATLSCSANEWEDAINSFFVATKTILTGGRGLFDQLATTQALDVTDSLYSQASQLVDLKQQLRDKIKQDDFTQHEMEADCDRIKAAIRKFSGTLLRFSEEMDKVSGLNAAPLHEQSLRLARAKSKELIAFEYTWKPHDTETRDAALKNIDAAIANSAKLEAALKCLKNTLNSRNLQCDPKNLI